MDHSLFIEARKTKNTPSEHDSWLGLASSNDDASAEVDVAGVTAEDVSRFDAVNTGADVADSAADITGDTGAPGDSTLTIDRPIGVLQLLSSSPAGGNSFNVVVASSTKDPLLFVASASGTSVGTAKISRPGGGTTLQNALITAISISSRDSNIAMTLKAGSPKKSGPATLTMDPPIGALPVISFSPADTSRRVFDATVASSTKDELLVLANVAGTSVGTVQFSLAGSTLTLRNTQIVSIRFGSPSSNLSMVLQSASPAELSLDS